MVFMALTLFCEDLEFQWCRVHPCSVLSLFHPLPRQLIWCVLSLCSEWDQALIQMKFVSQKRSPGEWRQIRKVLISRNKGSLCLKGILSFIELTNSGLTPPPGFYYQSIHVYLLACLLEHKTLICISYVYVITTLSSKPGSKLTFKITA